MNDSPLHASSPTTQSKPAAGSADSTGRAIVVAVACAVCMALGLATLFVGTFPLFLQPVSKDFGWGASIFPQSLMVAGVSTAVAGPIVGRFIDTHGVRPVLLPGLVLWAVAVFLLSRIGGSLVLLYAVCLLMGISAATCGPVALVKVISGWFDRRRGLVLNLVLGAAPAVATAMLLSLTQHLVTTRGWQAGYVTFAGLILVVAWPVCFLFLREAPTAKPLNAAIEAPPLEGVPALKAFRSRAFLTIMAASVLILGSANGVVSHLIPLSEELGIAKGTASLALTIYSLIGPVASLFAGAMADRAPHPRLLVPVFALPLVGVALLFTVGQSAVVIALACIGSGFAAVTGLAPFFTSRYFGLASASTIFGVALGILTLSLGLGPVLLGVVRDTFGSYLPAIPLLAGCLIVAIGLILSLPAYPRRPAGAA